MKDEIAEAIRDTLISPNVSDSNYEPANIVDALAMISNSIRLASRQLGSGNAASEVGAIEHLAMTMRESSNCIAESIHNLADAIRETKS